MAIRKDTYNKLCDMARVDNRTIGGEMTWLIDTAYEQVMWWQKNSKWATKMQKHG